MKQYFVCLPVTGEAHFFVEAENEEDAIKRASNIIFSINSKGIEGEEVYLEEIETHATPINQGNIFYGSCGEPYAEEEK